MRYWNDSAKTPRTLTAISRDRLNQRRRPGLTPEEVARFVVDPILHGIFLLASEFSRRWRRTPRTIRPRQAARAMPARRARDESARKLVSSYRHATLARGPPARFLTSGGPWPGVTFRRRPPQFAQSSLGKLPDPWRRGNDGFLIAKACHWWTLCASEVMCVVFLAYASPWCGPVNNPGNKLRMLPARAGVK